MNYRYKLSIVLLAAVLITSWTGAYGQSGDYAIKWEVNHNAWISNVGTGQFDIEPCRTYDFNGDSHPDLWCTVDSTFAVIDGENGAVVYSFPDFEGPRWSVLGIGQTDDDSSLEILFYQEGSPYEGSPWPDTLAVVDVHTGTRSIVRTSDSPDSRLRCRLVDIDGDGVEEIVGTEVNSNTPNTIVFCYDYDPVLTSINNGGNNQVPERFAVSQNYPNPFNPSTTIEYDIPRRGPVVLTVYNINGQVVDILVNEVQSAGVHNATWNGRNIADQPVASGVYFYRVESGDHVGSKKMVLLK